MSATATASTDDKVVDPNSANATAASPFVNWTAEEAKQHLLFTIARNFKGQNKDVDAKIDRAAAQIMGRPGISMIPPNPKGAPRVPLYMEGEPGVGKTSLIRAACIEFCAIAGLKFIENPPDGYTFGPNDFYYCTVNLSGKTNPMDIGGLPSKGALETQHGLEARRRATDNGEWLRSELVSRLEMGAGMMQLEYQSTAGVENGPMVQSDVAIKGEAGKVDLIVKNVTKQLQDAAKKRGVALNVLGTGDKPPEDGRLYLQIVTAQSGARVTAIAPKPMAADVEYVAEMLPNRRFAMAAKAPYCLFNFDDVANASEAVRNVLLEVAQSNSYSGVMNIKNALVTFTGNMGAEDGTNTQSSQSDAEVSRVFKARIRDTPSEWAKRIAGKYPNGDAYMSAFVERYGNEPGVFREPLGDERSEKGMPKPNSRSLENAVACMLPYFEMARESGLSPTVFLPEIKNAFKATAGAFTAGKFGGFLVAMLTDAVPLADELMATGKLDVELFDKHTASKTTGRQADFGYRFGYALAEAFVNRIAFSAEARKAADTPAQYALIEESTDRLAEGLAKLDPSQMNTALSHMMTKLGNIAKFGTADGVKVTLNLPIFNAMAAGFGRSMSRPVWPNPEKAGEDFVKIISGTNVGASTTKAKRQAPK